MSAGKGDTPRPVDGDAYRDNYEAAFSKAKRTDGDNPFMSSDDDNDSHNTNKNNIDEIIAERNKAQSECKYWKAEAKRWREVAIDQDGNIEVFIQRLNKRQDDIEMRIRGMKGGC